MKRGPMSNPPAVVALVALAPLAAARKLSRKTVASLSVRAGGGADYISRLIGQRLTEPLGQQIVIENRPAGRHGGTELGVKSTPDGYTLTMISSSYPVCPILKLSFDP